MSSPALRGSAEWSARREVALLLGLTRGNLYAAQQLWLRKERIKAEASQVASAGAPQASQQPVVSLLRFPFSLGSLNSRAGRVGVPRLRAA